MNGAGLSKLVAGASHIKLTQSATGAAIADIEATNLANSSRFSFSATYAIDGA